MIDHVLGRPSTKSRRLQVLTVLSLWSLYLARGHKHGPPFLFLRRISRFVSQRLSAWQTFLLTMLYLYASRNGSTLLGLASPDPLSNMYDATYFRATWMLTALDAGFWTAMPIRHKWLRDAASIVFSGFYLIAAEAADEKVRKVRGGVLTIDHLRVSWNKGWESPYLSFLQRLMRPRRGMMRWPPRAIRIQRPKTSDYQGEAVQAWLYFDGPLTDLVAKRHKKMVLDIPGGGFVAMNPRCNDDRLLYWAAKTGLPVLSLDYKKAPEYPYPYALNECFDVYTTLIQTRGRCIGLSGLDIPEIVLTGDSAGGNLAVSTTLMIIEQRVGLDGRASCFRQPGQRTRDAGLKSTLGFDIPVPAGLVLFYPGLDMNIQSWMSDEEMGLIRDRQFRTTNRMIVRRKSMQYDQIVGTPHPDRRPTAIDSLASGLQPLTTADTSSSTSSYTTSSSSHSTSSHSTSPSSSPAPRPGKPVSNPPESQTSSSLAGREPSKDNSKAAQETAKSNHKSKSSSSFHPQPMETRLAMCSMISYFNDRVLTPEMMRAMIILYIGPHNRPDFARDYLLSPVLAPDDLLAQFPKTYFLTGERDPLVDDTVIFAGKLRRAKRKLFDDTVASYRQKNNPTPEDDDSFLFHDKEVAQVSLILGISHGFLQFPSIYPPAWKFMERATEWLQDSFDPQPAFYSGSFPSKEETHQTGNSNKKEAVTRDAKTSSQQNTTNSYFTTKDTENKNEQDLDEDDDDCESPLEIRPPPRKVSNRTSPIPSASVVPLQDQETSENPVPHRPNLVLETSTPRLSSDSAVTTIYAPSTSDSGDSTVVVNGLENAGNENGPATALNATNVSKNPNGPSAAKPRKLKASRKDQSFLRLNSSDDLLGRRMSGLAGGLTRASDE